MVKRRVALTFVIAVAMFAQLACGGRGGGLLGGNDAAHFKPGFNLFSEEQDIKLGKQSAAEIARQAPLLRDEAVTGYVKQLGARLAAKAPGYKFPYNFEVVATRDINAFALPGGFLFVNAGAIAAARNEGELAGVMAHEIAHVALRHGTSQASKAYIAEAGLSVIGGLAGGDDSSLGQVINSIGGAGANALFLKFGRTAETQADLTGARIMAEAGYDPRDMAGFFQTLEAQGGQRTPEILSDHPNPGNRVKAINEIYKSLPVSANPVRDSEAFQQVKARLAGNRSALSSREPERLGSKPTRMGNRPAQPSANFKSNESEAGGFVITFPDNWDGLKTDDNNLIFAPKGAYGATENSGMVVTHGVFVGAVAVQQGDLKGATEEFVRRQIEANPDFQIARQPQVVQFGDRQGYATVVAGLSPVTGVTEVDVIYTTATSDGRLFYFITIVPEDERDAYQSAFERIIQSIRFAVQ